MSILWLPSCHSPMPCIRGKHAINTVRKKHFQSKGHSSNPRVNQVQVPKEVFHISQIGSGARAMITMEVGKPSPQSQVTFQLDTGAECNLLSLKDYKRAIGMSSCYKRILVLTSTSRRTLMNAIRFSVIQQFPLGDTDTPLYCNLTLQKMT